VPLPSPREVLDALAPYSKAIAAVVGVAIFVLFKRWGINVPGLDSLVLDLITGALIVGGVTYQAPANRPKR